MAAVTPFQTCASHDHRIGREVSLRKQRRARSPIDPAPMIRIVFGFAVSVAGFVSNKRRHLTAKVGFLFGFGHRLVTGCYEHGCNSTPPPPRHGTI